MKRSQAGWLFLCFLSTFTLAFSQTATTSLRGVIKDPSGALVAGARISLVNAADGTTFRAVADSSGSYVFPQIPPARYIITCSAMGFGYQIKKAELLVNQPATINFALSVQASAVTVDVSSEAQTLNTTDAILGDSVDNTMIQALPMEGRDPLALLTLQPGVLYLGNPGENNAIDSRSGSVSGGRSDQGNITLDGMDDNDQLNGTEFTGVLRSTLDSTEEFRVTTSNGTADSGRSSGAQISLITKSGTNAFHGALYEYYRPTNTVAKQWFNKYTELYLGEPNVPQKYVMNTFGDAAGGPIKKDKLFVFFNYEGQRQAINEVATRVVPTANFYAGELGYQDANGNTDWLTSAQVTALDETPDPNSAACPGLVNTDQCGIENLPGQPLATWTEDNTKGLAVGHTWTPTSNIVNDLRYGFARQGYSTRGIGSGQENWVVFRFLDQPAAHSLTTVVNVPVQNVLDNLTWAKGAHTLSVGGNWRGIQNNPAPTQTPIPAPAPTRTGFITFPTTPVR